MKVHATGDIVDGTVTGDAGIDVPEALAALPLGRLRLVDGALVDVGAREGFHLDPTMGLLHVVEAPGFVAVACGWDAPLVLDGGAYRLRTLDDDKAELCGRVDARAEAERLTLITFGSGQAMEYQEAFNEAVQVANALAADPAAAIDPAKFPMLAASVGSSLDPGPGAGAGLPTTDVPGEARAVLAAYDAFQRAGAAIRGARLRGKAAIRAAGSLAAARAAIHATAPPPGGVSMSGTCPR